jgi:ABC-type Fe3+ transport system permease subunit
MLRPPALVRFATVLAAAVPSSAAWADHGGALRSEGWSPLTSALVFGGLALLAGAVVIVVVAILTRRNHPSE